VGVTYETPDPTSQDLDVLVKAQSTKTGGVVSFTRYMYSPEGWKPRLDLVHTAPDKWKLKEHEYVPFTPILWQYALAHDPRNEVTIIGGFGSSKTLGMANAAIYWCCSMVDFAFLNVAPVAWQSHQMFKAAVKELIDWDRRHEIVRPIHRFIDRIVSRPYPVIYFKNGSRMEFMSADENGEKVLSWSGDCCCVDEADKLGTLGLELGKLIINVGSRTRGQVHGRPRMGRMIVMANAGADPELWERFDQAVAAPNEYLSITLKTSDNPYITADQYRAYERRIPDPQMRKQYMDAERPLPIGQEFSPALLARVMDTGLDEMMQAGLDRNDPFYRIDTLRKAGVVSWVIPPQENRTYVMVGDPGQEMPPNRNSACILVIDVTNFPKAPAELAAFWWGPQLYEQAGIYWPFIYKMEEFKRTYLPIYAGFDATGVQKGFDHLVFAQRGYVFEGINMANTKQAMVVALKLVMGKSLLKLPKNIQSIWLQLANWRMPDKKLRQDIASALFMVGYALTRLFEIDPREATPEDLLEQDLPKPDRNRRRAGDRHSRRR